MEDNEKQVWWEDIPDDISNTIFRLEMNIEGKGTISKDLRPDLKIDMDSLEDHLRMNASARYFWGSIHADLRRSVGYLDRAAKARKKVARREVIDSLIAEGVKQTDKLVDALVEGDTQILKIEEDIANAWSQVNKVDALIKAIDMRHESIRSIKSGQKTERNL